MITCKMYTVKKKTNKHTPPSVKADLLYIKFHSTDDEFSIHSAFNRMKTRLVIFGLIITNNETASLTTVCYYGYSLQAGYSFRMVITLTGTTCAFKWF